MNMMAHDTLAQPSLPHSAKTNKPVIHFAHANGMPSKAYQPMFEQLEKRFTIEYIPLFGINPNYPVDNHWQSLTQQIIDGVLTLQQTHQVDKVIGLGHSLGALCTLQAVYQRPELFAQAVLLDPPWIYGTASFLWHVAKTIDKLPLSQYYFTDKLSPSGQSKHRRDVWNSREEAYNKMRHKPFFKNFDERCFQGYIEAGLTETPDGKVTLSIPKDTEVKVFRTNPSWYWLTPNQPPACPVSIIVGQDSIFFKKQFPQKIEKRLKIHHLVHEGGHMFPLEFPESVALMIEQQIDKQAQ